jgi:ATP-dependent Clp protease adaptor protein ClpS
MPERVDPDSGVVTEPQSERKLKRPQLYKVLFHNDNYTTRDFVVAVLREVFHKSESDAVAIMLHVHNTGIGLAGVYTYDVARTKIEVVEALAREHEFPLRLTMEPEEISEPWQRRSSPRNCRPVSGCHLGREEDASRVLT